MDQKTYNRERKALSRHRKRNGIPVPPQKYIRTCPKHNHPIEYTAYSNAKRRCCSQSHPRYTDYGGRGIQFLFTSFEQFFAELGLRPEGKTLDRENNDGNYEPGNVRWATRSEQNSNKRRSAKQKQKHDLLRRRTDAELLAELEKRGYTVQITKVTSG